MEIKINGRMKYSNLLNLDGETVVTAFCFKADFEEDVGGPGTVEKMFNKVNKFLFSAKIKDVIKNVKKVNAYFNNERNKPWIYRSGYYWDLRGIVFYQTTVDVKLSKLRVQWY
jgi:hypothetical protein